LNPFGNHSASYSNSNNCENALYFYRGSSVSGLVFCILLIVNTFRAKPKIGPGLVDHCSRVWFDTECKGRYLI